MAGIRSGASINKILYEPETSTHRLSAAYCFGIARNPPFIDGNRRLALIPMGLFVRLNGFEMTTDPVETEETVLAVVTGSLNENQLSEWLELHTLLSK
ncbi:type II toxin-antitoxin system death-on-curing family toxin [Granulicella sibirica]